MNDAFQVLLNWETVRSEVIRLVQNGDWEKAIKLSNRYSRMDSIERENSLPIKNENNVSVVKLIRK